jgi:Uma2 family endonuclease
MSTVEHVGTEQRFLLHAVPWDIYLQLRDAPENEHVHMTYDRGELEMMSPSKTHEQYASLMERLLHTWTMEQGIDIQSCRTMTFKREDLQHGLEPDNCYYIANEALVRNHSELDLTADPPPDLAVEIDLSGSARRSKLAMYAAFGVPEVWWFDGTALSIFALAEGQYQERPTSVSFPNLPPAEIERVLGKLGMASETTLVRSFRDWMRREGLGIGD